MRRRLNVLIACEESQAECSAFRALGHNAYSCDIQQVRPKGNPSWHICQDVTPLLDGATKFNTQDGKRHTVDHWDLIVAHPPCTYLCKVSSVWMKTLPDLFISRLGQIEHVNANRYYAMLAARDFFFQCLHAQALYVAVENPLPMAMADLPQPSCFLEPSWFGVKYTKKTLFWLRNLPPIMPELEHPYPKCFVKASRGKYRSRTFPQVAHAIARQWSEFIFNDQHPDASTLLP